MKTIAIAAGLCLCAAPALAEGDLANLPESLEPIVLGIGDNTLGVSVNEHRLETGKAYSLVIESTGSRECAWEAPSFFQNAWIRKIEVGTVEIKVQGLNEIEMEREGEAEIFFVPIRPGTYQWACSGLEERGMAGQFIVK